MLDYEKLRKDFFEVLSKISQEEIKQWLEFDEERIANESFIEGEKITIKVNSKTTEINFNNIDTSISILETDDEFNLAA